MRLHGKFRRTLNRRNVYEFPTLKLRAIAQVGIFGYGVVLPSSGFLDHRSSQDARSAVEVEEESTPGASDMLQHKVPVQQHRLYFGKQIVMAIEIAPSRLHHPDVRISEVMHRALQKIA